MPEGTITTIGGLNPDDYTFASGVKLSNGYFQVDIAGKPGTKITSSEMLFILYAIHQSVNSEKVQRNAEVAEYLTNYSTAVSNLTKVFALYSASFDGEYIKQGMAPEGAIGMIKGYNGSSGDDYDEVTWGDADATDNEDGDHPVDVNAKTIQMTAAHVKEALQNYVAAYEAYQTLNGKYADALEDLNVSMSEFPSFPFGSEFINYREAQEFTISSDLMRYYRAFTKGSPDSNSEGPFQTTYANSFLESWNSLGLGTSSRSGAGNFRFTTQSGDEQNQGASVYYINVGGAGTKVTTQANEGDDPAINDENLSKVAYYLFSKGSAILNAAGASERKETYNNEMNQANTFTQTVSQAASRALSKVDSLQSMVDRNMNKIFENLSTIARGGS